MYKITVDNSTLWSPSFDKKTRLSEIIPRNE